MIQHPNEVDLLAHKGQEFARLTASAIRLGRKYQMALHAQYQRQTQPVSAETTPQPEK